MKLLSAGLLFTACMFNRPLYAPSFDVLTIAYQQGTEPERLMNLFLKAVQSDNENEVKKFINENYSTRFLEIPMTAHLNVINNLHKDFAHLIVAQTIRNGTMITVIIKSPVNKTKRITIETDQNIPAKILIIDLKEDN
jgi:hypothetical protein